MRVGLCHFYLREQGIWIQPGFGSCNSLCYDLEDILARIIGNCLSPATSSVPGETERVWQCLYNRL